MVLTTQLKNKEIWDMYAADLAEKQLEEEARRNSTIFNLANLGRINEIHDEYLKAEEARKLAEEEKLKQEELARQEQACEDAFFAKGERMQTRDDYNEMLREYARDNHMRHLEQKAAEQARADIFEQKETRTVMPKLGLWERFVYFANGFVPQPEEVVLPVQQDVTGLATKALKDFVAEYRQDLATVSTGVRHFFARRKLKKKLEEHVYNECALRYTSSDEYKGAKDIASNVFDALVPRSEEMSDMYLTTDDMGGNDLDELVRQSVFSYTQRGSIDAHAMQNHVIETYGAPTIPPAPAYIAQEEPAVAVDDAPLIYEEEVPRQGVSWFTKAAATAGIVAALLGIGAPAAEGIDADQSRITDDYAMVDDGSDFYASYAVDAAETRPAVQDAPEPEQVYHAQSRSRARPAARSHGDAGSSSMDHMNPVASAMPQISAGTGGNYAAPSGDGLEELARPAFRDSVNGCLADAAWNPDSVPYGGSCYNRTI